MSEDSLLLRNLSSCKTAMALVQRIAVWMREYRVNAMLATSSSSVTTPRDAAAVNKQQRSCNRKTSVGKLSSYLNNLNGFRYFYCEFCITAVKIIFSTSYWFAFIFQFDFWGAFCPSFSIYHTKNVSKKQLCLKSFNFHKQLISWDHIKAHSGYCIDF